MNLSAHHSSHSSIPISFAHEPNYYCSATADAAGGVVYGQSGAKARSNFKLAFKKVSQALAKYAPNVDMVYSPMWTSNLTVLKQWAPSKSLYKYVAVDYYPDSEDELTAASFISQMQPFHDYFTSDTIKMIVAEGGLHLDTTKAVRLQWLKTITSTQVQKALPNLVSVTWFNLNLR